MNASIISKGLAHECDGWHCVDDSGTAKLPPAEDRLGEEAFRAMDRMREALSAQMTGGLSPALLALAFMDWSIHLASAPGKCAEIIFKADRKIGRLAAHAAAIGIATDDCPCIEPLPGDYRFVSDTWRKPPYSLWAQAFLLNQQWWHNVTHKVAGVTPHHEEVVSFAGRQFPDMFSPSNILFANPEVVEKTIKSGGQNFVHGFRTGSRMQTGLQCSNRPRVPISSSWERMAALLPERWFTGTILGTARFSAAFQHLRAARVSIHNLVNCSAEGFALAMDVSCRSFIRMAKFAAPPMIDGSCLLTISFYGGAGESCS